MRWSRAALDVASHLERTSVMRAHAAGPQRWSLSRGSTGWVEATHQVLGDGVFGGDTLATRVTVGPGACLLVRAAAATPLRGCARSRWTMRVRVSAGGTAILLPGALIPHTGADHEQALRVDVAGGGRVLVASVVCPGRVGMREHGTFRRLRLRTSLRMGPQLAFAEDSTLEPAELPLRNGALFGDLGAALSIVAVGDWGPAQLEWWAAIQCDRGLGGASRLGRTGVAFRGVFPSLGDATDFLSVIEERAQGSADHIRSR